MRNAVDEGSTKQELHRLERSGLATGCGNVKDSGFLGTIFNTRQQSNHKFEGLTQKSIHLSQNLYHLNMEDAQTVNHLIKKITGSPGQTRPLISISITSSWWAKIWQLILFQILVCYLVVLSQFKVVLVGTWRYWVSIRWYWLVLGCTRLVWGRNGWYFISRGWLCLFLDVTGSV